MAGRLTLVQPVTAQIDATGRLLHADEPLMRLHILAGGEDGGYCAIPALAALAQRTWTTKMRFARPAHIACHDENIDIWVESHFEHGIVYLSILSWASSPIATFKASVSGGYAEPYAAPLIAFFDKKLKLIAIKGVVWGEFDRGDIGRLMTEVFVAGEEDREKFKASVENFERFDLTGVRWMGGGDKFTVTGVPEFSDDGGAAGYHCEMMRQVDMPVKANRDAALFGQHLAPILRQPLGRIIANAETINTKLHGPIRENYATYAKDIAGAARHLSTLLDDLGDLEAVEKPGFSTAKDEIILGDIVGHICGLLALKAADHRIILHQPTAETTVNAVAEFRRVLQIMLNLVTNAIRYSPDGSEVFIEVEDEGDFATISVIDQGEGILPEDQERIFQKFERLGRSGDGGSGLGLYISRRLARFMGGDLTVGITNEGGAKFTLHLPKS